MFLGKAHTRLARRSFNVDFRGLSVALLTGPAAHPDRG